MEFGESHLMQSLMPKRIDLICMSGCLPVFHTLGPLAKCNPMQPCEFRGKADHSAKEGGSLRIIRCVSA